MLPSLFHIGPYPIDTHGFFVLLGYTLLSLGSAGTCTLLVDDPTRNALVGGLFLYPIAVVLLALGIAIFKVLKK